MSERRRLDRDGRDVTELPGLWSEDDWRPADDAPEGVVVETMIDDGFEGRNHQALKRRGRLWFVADGSIYVYYEPTHWRPSKVTEGCVP